MTIYWLIGLHICYDLLIMPETQNEYPKNLILTCALWRDIAKSKIVTFSNTHHFSALSKHFGSGIPSNLILTYMQCDVISPKQMKNYYFQQHLSLCSKIQTISGVGWYNVWLLNITWTLANITKKNCLISPFFHYMYQWLW